MNKLSKQDLDDIGTIVKKVLEKSLDKYFGDSHNQKITKIENNLDNLLKIQTKTLNSLRKFNTKHIWINL